MNFTYDDPLSRSYSPQTMRAIEAYLNEEIEKNSIEENPLKFREHLGVSIIGEPCSAKLWYGFRWVKLENFSGRMRRLFKRGHSEEEKFQTILHQLGFFVRSIDPATDKQYKFSAIGGHYGGSGDSLALMPWDRDNDGQRILVEYKTHNKRLFEQLKKDRVKIAQPKHWAQMCGYGEEFKVKYALYCAVNKDDDDLYVEFLELDWNYAKQLKNKAQDIITAKIRPERISENPAFHVCKFCTFQEICHFGASVEINCRSCSHAEPKDKAEWFCNLFKQTIPSDFIVKGCNNHVSINNA